MATTVVNSALGFVFWWIAARAFEPSTVGLAAAIVSAMAVTSLVCGVGSDAIVIAVLPTRAPGAAWSLTLNAALAAGMATSAAGAGVCILLLPGIATEFSTIAGYAGIWFAVGVVAWTASTVLDATFVAERTARFMLWRNASFAAAKLVLLVVAVLLSAASWLAIFVPWILASVASIAIAMYLVMRLGRRYELTTSGILSEIRAVRSRLAGHHLIGLFGALPPLVLPVLVAARLSPGENAYFYATWMVGGVFFVVSPAVASALFAEGSHDRGDISLKIATSVRIIFGLLAPIAVIYLLAGHFVLGLFGPDYADAGWPVLLLLLTSAVPDAITNIYVAVMRVHGCLAIAALLNLAIAAITVALCWALLPGMGIEAAALAWLIAQSVGALAAAVHTVVLRRRFRGHASSLPR